MLVATTSARSNLENTSSLFTFTLASKGVRGALENETFGVYSRSLEKRPEADVVSVFGRNVRMGSAKSGVINVGSLLSLQDYNGTERAL